MKLPKSELLWKLDNLIRAFDCDIIIELVSGQEVYHENISRDPFSRNSSILWLVDKINKTNNFELSLELYLEKAILDFKIKYESGMLSDHPDNNFKIVKFMLQEI